MEIRVKAKTVEDIKLLTEEAIKNLEEAVNIGDEDCDTVAIENKGSYQVDSYTNTNTSNE